MEGSKLRILVVDDEPDLCWVLRESLRPDGHEITTVESAKAARRTLREGSFDLAFIDLRLPDGDGWKIVQSLKRKHLKTKIAIISGYHEPSSEISLDRVQSGYELIEKPFDLKQIRQVVEACLPRSLGTRQGGRKAPIGVQD